MQIPLMKPHIVFALFILALITALQSSYGISISNKAGITIEVEILKIENARIQIRLINGAETWFDRDQLSAQSQQAISQIETEEQSKFEVINHLLGIPLLVDNNLWDDTAKTVAQRLNWPQESQTATQSSYRYYPHNDFRILNTRPYASTLYGANNQANLISIVFANKGDFPFSNIPTEDEIEAMQAAIQRDEDTLIEHLSDVLGSPEKQSFGTGRGIKERIQRWNWNGHAVLLASQQGEYVSLRIMSTAAADNKGRNKKLSDTKLRKLTTENITTRPNGDVLISNIPMVNQGPKGYCVPATFERYLRYMQIPADMYLLAMAGQTQIGGGTTLNGIIDAVDGYISSQSRTMKELNEPIKVRTIQKYIDKGLPIIWTMFSSREYNQHANQRTVERQSVTDWEAWRKSTKSIARSTELRQDILSAHACLIIGYNKTTGEIAVSDSWGPSYNERWIAAEQAQQVSQGSIYLISF